MSVSSVETGECPTPARKLFAGIKFHVFKPSFAGDEGNKLVDLIWANGGLTASNPSIPRVSIVVVSLPSNFPRDLILSLDSPTRDPRVNRGIFSLVWTCGVVLGQKPPRPDQRKHIVRAEWVHECVRRGELFMQDRDYGGWDIRGTFDPRDISRLPNPRPTSTNPVPPRAYDSWPLDPKEDRRPLHRPKSVSDTNGRTTHESVAKLEPGAGLQLPRASSTPDDNPALAIFPCYVPRVRPSSPDPSPPLPQPTLAASKTMATPFGRPATPTNSGTTAVLIDSKLPSEQERSAAATSQSVLHPSHSLGSPFLSAKSPSRIGAAPPTEPRMHRPAILDNAELETERIKETTRPTTAATISDDRTCGDNSGTSTHSSIHTPELLDPTTTSIKPATTIDDFFTGATGVATRKPSWDPDSFVINSSNRFDKTKTSEAQLKIYDVPGPIIATGQQLAFVASPVAISPVNGGALPATSPFATAGYHRAMDPRFKRQDRQTDGIKDIECDTVPVGGSKSDSVTERHSMTEDPEKVYKTASASPDAGPGVEEIPDVPANEIIDLTYSPPSKAVKSKLPPLALPPPLGDFKLALEPTSLAAREYIAASTLQTIDRSHLRGAPLGRKGTLDSSAFLPTPRAEPVEDPLLNQAAIRQPPKTASRDSPRSQAMTTVTQTVTQTRASNIFHPSGLLPSSFYLAVPEPYNTSLGILITSFGGGCITTADRATYIILGYSGSVGRGHLSPGDEQLEWVNACIRAGQMVDLEPYRIVSGSMAATPPGPTVERITPSNRRSESLGVTRGVSGAGSAYDQELQLAGVGGNAEVPNRARHDDQAEANYQHYEEDEETCDDPAFLQELQALADQDDGSDFEMPTSEVMSDEESELLGEERYSSGQAVVGVGSGNLGPRERTRIWEKDREVYEWMVDGLKQWDQVGQRHDFLQSLTRRCPFGRSCHTLFVSYRSLFERDVPGLKDLARPHNRKPRQRQRLFKAKTSANADAKAKTRSIGERSRLAPRSKKITEVHAVEDRSEDELPSQRRPKRPRRTM